MIACTRCGLVQDQGLYYTNGPNRYRTECKRCTLLAQKANKHGTTVESLLKRWEQQRRSCLICLQEKDILNLHVDHDHKCCPPKKSGNYCGKCIRALLCPTCNTGLGLFKDNEMSLFRAAFYVGYVTPESNIVQIDLNEAGVEGTFKIGDII